ncbi:hypothetical protein BHE74_00034817 [Ensete ventricosum]|nr:hypothetical protein BHE74_00034817 [Ensete ventricosum]
MRPYKVGWVTRRPKRVVQSSQRLILHSVKAEGSFETHAPYRREAFDRGTKTTQLAETELGSKDLSTGQEDTEASTLKEYVTVLPFELLLRKPCAAEIVLVGE